MAERGMGEVAEADPASARAPNVMLRKVRKLSGEFGAHLYFKSSGSDLSGF